ncbi:amino acid adenylation domain-containing protein [Dactylosporangium matsuzakiense]|uniref:Amino acid adenylation domain-containing protein n=1 Tax=Dactylosporangium matsuzakiense TaxID=53360 RepID=A0A9W6KND9_9ACTN|nr:amino acid adenylation domain-containing protein [Dactylosporangium matsuzakiense]GLL03739.1 hypothetical protein GCM10017581_054850 [Dactylosporangium matsuzakiense]
MKRARPATAPPDSAAAPADTGLARLPLLPGAARQATTRALRHPVTVDTTAGVWPRVAATAATDPDRAAVVTAAGTVTYDRLAHRVRQIRTILHEHGCGTSDRVAVAGERGTDLIAAFLAIESIGAAYVPLDRAWTDGRIAVTVRRIRPSCLLLLDVPDEAAARIARAVASTATPVVRPPDHGAVPASDAAPRTIPGDEPRYILHTSGSSGTPKGTVVEHAGMMNHLWSMVDRLGLTPADRIAFTAPPSYVVSVWQMLTALLIGAAVVVFDEPDTNFGRRLVAHAEHCAVTVLELVPTVLGWVMDHVMQAAAPMPHLRVLLSTGEALGPELARRVRAGLRHVQLFNAYGCTECSDDVALHLVDETDLHQRRLPAGTPIANAVLYVLVEEGDGWRAAEPGEVGQLWVGGLPVSAGYWDDPELTGAVFFADEFDPGSPTGRLYHTGDLAVFRDGVVHCLGRVDRQVKVAGIRVELDGIEQLIAAVPGVVGCAVTAHRRDDRTEIVVRYVADTDIAAATFRRHLQDAVPPAALPRRWIRLDALPLNGNGKVDHHALARNLSDP